MLKSKVQLQILYNTYKHLPYQELSDEMKLKVKIWFVKIEQQNLNSKIQVNFW